MTIARDEVNWAPMINIFEGPVSVYRQEFLRVKTNCYVCEDPQAQTMLQGIAASGKAGELLERWRIGLGLKYQVELPASGTIGSSRLKVGACANHESNLSRLHGLLGINNGDLNPLILDVSRRQDPLTGCDLTGLFEPESISKQLDNFEIARRFRAQIELQQAVYETRAQLIKGVVPDGKLLHQLEWNYWMNNRSRFFEEFIEV